MLEGLCFSFHTNTARCTSPVYVVSQCKMVSCLIATSTSDKLFRGINIDDLERPWTPKIGSYGVFLVMFWLRRTFQEWLRRQTTDRRHIVPNTGPNGQSKTNGYYFESEVHINERFKNSSIVVENSFPVLRLLSCGDR